MENREGIMALVTDNLNSEEMRTYLDRDAEGHKESVEAVSALLEDHFNEPTGPGSVLHPEESELRQSMYNDQRSVADQIRELADPKSDLGKAYVDSGHPRHDEAVRRGQILFEARHDEHPRTDPDARWPVRIRTKPNSKQDGNETNF